MEEMVDYIVVITKNKKLSFLLTFIHLRVNRIDLELEGSEKNVKTVVRKNESLDDAFVVLNVQLLKLVLFKKHANVNSMKNLL